MTKNILYNEHIFYLNDLVKVFHKDEIYKILRIEEEFITLVDSNNPFNKVGHHISWLTLIEEGTIDTEQTINFEDKSITYI